MAETVFSLLRKEIGTDIDQIKLTLYNNRVKDIEQYRFLTGQLLGLTTALDRVKALESKVEED